MQKIVINALQYKPNSSGIGAMIRDLFGSYSRLSKRTVQVILTRDGPEFPGGPKTEFCYIPYDHSQGIWRMFFQTVVLGRKCKDSILLTTDSKTPLFLPKNCKLVSLVTDLAVYRMPEVYQRSRALWWRFQYQYLRHRADLFLAISKFTKGEMTELLDIPAEKIQVVSCACSPRFRRVKDTAAVQNRYGLTAPFLLFVGNANPRKNLTRLLRAFDSLKKQKTIPHQLVVAGEQGWKFDKRKALEDLEHREDIRFIGFVPDEDMPALYSAASMFVFPSLYEGFGIPVLEAQSCGVPVLASGCSSLPEVGGMGALYVDPYDEDSISEGMWKLLTDQELAQRLVQAGYENVKRFSWEKSAERLCEIIEKEVGYGLDGTIPPLD